MTDDLRKECERLRRMLFKVLYRADCLPNRASLFDDELLDWYRQHLDGCTAGKLDDEEAHASLCRALGDGAPEFYEHWKREGETI